MGSDINFIAGARPLLPGVWLQKQLAMVPNDEPQPLPEGARDRKRLVGGTARQIREEGPQSLAQDINDRVAKAEADAEWLANMRAADAARKQDEAMREAILASHRMMEDRPKPPTWWDTPDGRAVLAERAALGLPAYGSE